MLTPGQQVGNYVVEEKIGEGGMATVYRVRHKVLGSVHALKALDDDLRRKNPELRDRFLDEGRIAARIIHPNIVRVTDVLAIADVAGLVMDLVDGPSLDGFIAKRVAAKAPPLGMEDVLAIFLPVLAALGEAHRHGVVHRDLKPANILLRRSGDGFVPRVTDFGIAKIVDERHRADRRARRTTGMLGTWGYMSPEQIEGAAEADARSDIFALGATLYELVTGRIAFDGESPFVVRDQIARKAYVSPESLGAHPTLAAAIRRALEPEPAKRFASCEAFAAALAPERKETDKAGSPLSTPAPTRRAIFSAALVGGGAVLALSIGLFAYLGLAWLPARESRLAAAADFTLQRAVDEEKQRAQSLANDCQRTTEATKKACEQEKYDVQEKTWALLTAWQRQRYSLTAECERMPPIGTPGWATLIPNAEQARTARGMWLTKYNVRPNQPNPPDQFRGYFVVAGKDFLGAEDHIGDIVTGWKWNASGDPEWRVAYGEGFTAKIASRHLAFIGSACGPEDVRVAEELKPRPPMPSRLLSQPAPPPVPATPKYKDGRSKGDRDSGGGKKAPAPSSNSPKFR